MLVVEWLGRLGYREALGLQQRGVDALRREGAPDRLLLLEHAPVVTLGRSARPEHLLVPEAELARRGIELVAVARGGGVSFHGPGQLVGYLIADLARQGAPDLHAHLRGIEAALGRALGALGVPSRARAGLTGVFVERPECRKIASIGVGVRGWVSYHGFALNVGEDLSGFDVIVPCGLRDVAMTSVARELGAAAPAGLAARVRDAVAEAFAAAWS